MNNKYLTPEGFEKLQEELDFLRNQRRREVAERLQTANEEGNKLSEDPEYESAKNEQAFVEGRIRELEILLAQARIIENGVYDDVQIGAKVTIQENGTSPEQYTIVGAAEANPRNGLISHESPLGKALLNHKAGETVAVEAPSGAFSVKILDVE
jgi:transcription elongation factor GreA